LKFKVEHHTPGTVVRLVFSAVMLHSMQNAVHVRCKVDLMSDPNLVELWT